MFHTKSSTVIDIKFQKAARNFLFCYNVTLLFCIPPQCVALLPLSSYTCWHINRNRMGASGGEWKLFLKIHSHVSCWFCKWCEFQRRFLKKFQEMLKSFQNIRNSNKRPSFKNRLTFPTKNPPLQENPFLMFNNFILLFSFLETCNHNSVFWNCHRQISEQQFRFNNKMWIKALRCTCSPQVAEEANHNSCFYAATERTFNFHRYRFSNWL